MNGKFETEMARARLMLRTAEAERSLALETLQECVNSGDHFDIARYLETYARKYLAANEVVKEYEREINLLEFLAE